MAIDVQVQDIADANIDNTEETLVPSFELALIEYLDGNYGRILDGADRWLRSQYGRPPGE
jgi:hypothetical protein